MTPKEICIQDLNAAISFSRQIKSDIALGKYKRAINGISDLLFVMGRALACINRLEFIRGKRKLPSASANPAVRPMASAAQSQKQCIRFVNLAIANFETARRYVRQGRYEDAEDAIAAALTGRILRCVNRLRP